MTCQSQPCNPNQRFDEVTYFRLKERAMVLDLYLDTLPTDNPLYSIYVYKAVEVDNLIFFYMQNLFN